MYLLILCRIIKKKKYCSKRFRHPPKRIIRVKTCLSHDCQTEILGKFCRDLGLLWRSCEGSSREGLEKIPHGERSFEMNLKVSSIEWYICNHYRREKQGLTAFQTGIILFTHPV